MSQLPSDSSNSIVWKPDLYRLQQQAPTGKPVPCQTHVDQRPPYYGAEYHGAISHNAAAKLLRNEGEYLIRLSPNSDNYYTLSLRICSKIHHFKLYYDGQHYVDIKKHFNTISELVAEGIVVHYVTTKAGTYIQLMHASSNYEESPYMTLNRLKRMKMKRLSLSAKDLEPIIEYDKPHSFKSHTFKGFYWCELCGNFLWGFIAQGVRCEDCGFSAHFKCSEKLPPDCCPDLKQLRGVFGIDLTTLVKAHRTTRPFVIDKCIKEIEYRGLHTEGLYRVSGYQDEMDYLRLAFDKDGEKADIGFEACESINVVASILKLYLRLLPIPLITYDVHPALIAALDNYKRQDEQIHHVRSALKSLPPAHYNTLKYLIQHLHKVTAYSEHNKMPSQNLSTVFAPSIMPPPDLDKNEGALPDMCSEISAINFLITNHDRVFD